MNVRCVARKYLALGSVVCLFAICGQSVFAQGKATAAGTVPGTAADAKKVVDLSTAPLMKDAQTPRTRTFAKLQYEAPGKNEDAYQFHRKQLLAQKWKEDADNLSITGTFRRDGYIASITVFSIQEGVANISVQNHGNMNLAKLPLPAGSKEFLSTPAQAVFRTSAKAPATVKALQKSMGDKGWQTYGIDDTTISFKQNAVKLQFQVSPPDEPKGQTTISITSELMAYDFPAPPDATELEYKEDSAQLVFNTKAKPAAVGDFYIKALTKNGWTSKAKTLTKTDDGQSMTFENANKDKLTLSVTTDDGKTHVELKQEAGESADKAGEDKAEKTK